MKPGRKSIPHQSIDGTAHKWCGGCSSWKPLSEFRSASPSKPTWDGKRHHCAECCYVEHRKYRLKYEAKLKANPPPPATEPKRCPRCDTVKPPTDFYPSVTRPDGMATYCKSCSREYTGKRAKTERVKTVRRAWAASEKRLRAHENYFAQEKNRNKKRAQTEVLNAMRRGELVRPNVCKGCDGSERIEAHHDDYNFPLEVRWLCRWCHRAWHREHGEGRNAHRRE